MRRRISIVLFLIAAGSCFATGQINVISKQTRDIGPGLSVPSLWAQFYGSMNTHIAAQDVIVSHKDYQYIAYYNDERYVVMGRRQLCDRDWEFFVFEDYKQITNDRHNHISIGICPNDGTIHISFDHHVDTLNYRISVPDLANHPEYYIWGPDLFSEVRDYLIPGQIQPKITYPVFFQTHDGNLNMVFRYRGSGNAESYIGFYNGISHSWEDVHKFIESIGEYQDPYLSYVSYSRNAYPFYFIYDDDGWLHASWVWRESSQSRYNHDIAYAKSPDYGRTWFNNEGDLIGKITNTDTTYISYDSPGLNVWIIDSRYGMINNGGMTLDQHGQPHIIVFHRVFPKVSSEPSFVSYNDGRHHHYWRTPDGSWHKQQTWFRGSRPRLYSDSRGNMYMTLIDRLDSLDAASPNIVRVAVADANSGWSNWYQIYEGIIDTRKNEPPADPVYLREQGVFTVVSHEFHDYVLDGPMLITDLYTDAENFSKIEVGISMDTYVMNGNNHNKNFGDSHILVVNDHPGDSLDRKIYLQFHLDKLNELDVTGIISAELVMGTLFGSNGYNDEEYGLYMIENDTWEEMEINWDNAPGQSGHIQSIAGDPRFMRWDITGEILEELSGDRILSLCILKNSDTSFANLSFHAKESSTTGLSPKIIVKAESSCMQKLGLLTTINNSNIEYKNSKIRVYPNPVHQDQIYIDGLDDFVGQEVMMETFDVSGRQVMSEKIGYLPSSTYVFGLKNCGNGLHMLSINSGDKTQNIKILIKR